MKILCGVPWPQPRPNACLVLPIEVNKQDTSPVPSQISQACCICLHGLLMVPTFTTVTDHVIAVLDKHEAMSAF